MEIRVPSGLGGFNIPCGRSSNLLGRVTHRLWLAQLFVTHRLQCAINSDHQGKLNCIWVTFLAKFWGFFWLFVLFSLFCFALFFCPLVVFQAAFSTLTCPNALVQRHVVSITGIKQPAAKQNYISRILWIKLKVHLIKFLHLCMQTCPYFYPSVTGFSFQRLLHCLPES